MDATTSNDPTTTGATAAMPEVVERESWQAQIDALRIIEKAHTREGDAIAAARRRLPMVEVDAHTQVVGAKGPVTLLEVFEGRQQLVAYYHMWFDGEPAAEQCEGCTFCNGQVRELAYLHAKGITYATICWGSYDESVRYRNFMGWDVPWYAVGDSADVLRAGRTFNRFMVVCYVRRGDRVFETYWTTGRGVEPMTPTLGLFDMTVYGRQEDWENSPDGWPKAPEDESTWRKDGRPTAQWPRLEAGRSDDLRPATDSAE
jgi:predicted dithiol-disulfide oxidoreductase (DUF899 family)